MHSCPECGQACYCGGDVDDIDTGDTESSDNCTCCAEGDFEQPGRRFLEWGTPANTDKNGPFYADMTVGEFRIVLAGLPYDAEIVPVIWLRNGEGWETIDLEFLYLCTDDDRTRKEIDQGEMRVIVMGLGKESKDFVEIWMGGYDLRTCKRIATVEPKLPLGRSGEDWGTPKK